MVDKTVAGGGLVVSTRVSHLPSGVTCVEDMITEEGKVAQ